MPGDNITSKVPEGTYTKSRAAQLVPMPYWTLHRWLATKQYVPARSMPAGKLQVHILDDTDIQRLRELHKPTTREKKAG